jgi:hypothetical protein
MIAERKDAERVDPEALLMELPEVSLQEWERAATQYVMEASQFAFFLRQESNDVEILLDRADVEITRGNVASAKSILTTAWTELSAEPPIQSMHACVRAGLLAGRIGDEDLRLGIVPNVSHSLRRVGLTDVAAVVDCYEDLSTGLGEDTAALLRLGTIARVNAWALRASTHGDVEE